MVLIAPEVCLVRRVDFLSMAGQHIRPITLSKLTEIERFNRAAFNSILNALELLFSGEIHALEFIQQ